MKYLVLCTCFCFTAARTYQVIFDQEHDEYWERYKKVYGKRYEQNEEVRRRLIWEENVADIVRHNINADLGVHSYRQGFNAFTDMDHDEFKRLYNGFIPPKDLQSVRSKWKPLPKKIKMPNAVDWRKLGYVTPIKHQQQCGSCWAFSANGALEGQHKKKTGKLVSLSEQQLLDCSAAYGNIGCNGGSYFSAFQYISDVGGIDTEISYPYKAKVGPACLFNNQTIGATCRGSRTVTGFNEAHLQEAVATVGPIAVGIDASHKSFMSYNSGIYDESKCQQHDLNHAALVIGYGTEGGKDYWLVKNSYGTGWGLNGYMKISRNNNNKCGIASYAAYPLV